MYIIICEIDHQSRFDAMHETGCSGLVHWDDPGVGMGREVGEGFWMGNTCVPEADSCQCMAKTTTIL